MNQSTICFVAGGSGGHIIPLLVLAEEQCTQNNATPLFMITTKTIDGIIREQYSPTARFVSFSCMTPPSLNRFWRYPLFCAQFFFIFFKSLFLFLYHRPTALVTTGGYLSIPVCLAAFVARIPLDVYELNAVPGRASRVLAFIAKNVYVVFESCQKVLHASKVTRYPLRFSSASLGVTREQALVQLIEEQKIKKNPFLLCKERPTLFVMGGSQGSTYINEVIKRWCTLLPDTLLFQVIHQVGFSDEAAWKNFYGGRKIPAIVFKYRHDIIPCYRVADVILTRAGAGSLFEIEFFKKRSIVIPLTGAASNHQQDNAYEMARKYPLLFHIQEQQPLDRAVVEFHNCMQEWL